MNDEALNEEDPEFKTEENDKRIFRSLFNPLTPTIYDASWFDLDPKITITFLDFMFESRRTPLVFCFIKSSLNNLYKRLINFEEIEKEFNNLVEKSKKKRQEEVDKFIKEKKESEENVEIDPEEIKRMLEEPDPDLPRLEEMKDKAKESTTNRFGENKNFLKEFRNAIKEKNIPVIKVKNDKKIEETVKTLIDKLNPFIRQRKNLIEKQLVHSKLSYVQERKLKELESSDIFRLSLYKNYSPLCPERLVRKTNYPVIYRDRIYYFSSEEEKQKFIAEPLNYRSGKEFPLDINNSKKIFIIGNLKSGKTTISKILEEKGYLKITLKQTLYDLYETQKKNPMILHDCILRNNLEDIVKNVMILSKF
jgi:YHS domain-containing protein